MPARGASFTVALLLLASSAARADAGVPMIFVTMPMMAVALVPIILVEAWIMARRLHLAVGLTGRSAVLANLASTLVGIPLTWGALVILEILTRGGRAYGIDTLKGKLLAVTWQAAWLIPYEPELRWMVPAAQLVLLVPFFFASWLVEWQVSRPILRDIPSREVLRAVFLANAVSYLLLATWPAFVLINSLRS